MKHYLKLLLQFIKYWWAADMEFRANFLIWLVVNLAWALFAILFVEIIFGQIDAIAGWNKGEVMLLAATQIAFVGALWFNVIPNAKRFSNLIRNGELDFYLLKPVNLRFLVSTRFIEFDNLPNVFLAPILIPVILNLFGYSVQPLWAVGYVVLLVLGLVIFYNVFFMLMTFNFWWQNIFNLENLFDSIIDVGRYPVYIFKGISRLIFMYALPVVFVATFPVEALLGRSSWEKGLIAVAMVIVTSVISQKFWRFALKHYSSASS